MCVCVCDKIIHYDKASTIFRLKPYNLAHLSTKIRFIFMFEGIEVEISSFWSQLQKSLRALFNYQNRHGRKFLHALHATEILPIPPSIQSHGSTPCL